MKIWNRLLPLLLVAVLFAASAVPSFAARPDRDSIVDVALAVNASGDYAGSFDVLIAALLAADESILATLDGNGQFTVFAPTDGAFENLFDADEDAIVTLLGSIEDGSQEQADLTNILLYHVARGNREAATVVTSDRIRMLNRDFTFISIQDGLPFINDAQIIVPDVTAPANGVIHVIDAVLVPDISGSDTADARYLSNTGNSVFMPVLLR